jgi:DNA-binding response OmpR family regulator
MAEVNFGWLPDRIAMACWHLFCSDSNANPPDKIRSATADLLQILIRLSLDCWSAADLQPERMVCNAAVWLFLPSKRRAMHILVVEDEPAISNFIRKGLEENGYSVTQAFDGESGLDWMQRQPFDLVVLDLILPGIDGLEFCETLRRERQASCPVLMLTALSTTEDVVTGLDAGADDYLGKPFKFKELLARIRALSRRSHQFVPVQANRLFLQDLEVDLDMKLVRRGGKEIRLTPREFFLLEYLVRNQNKVVSRMDILEHVWDIQFDIGTNVVDVYMNYLRNKIDKPFENKLIQTVVGMGYMVKS